jgi:pimeloyl-ACP methyl ester carboxylesterase
MPWSGRSGKSLSARKKNAAKAPKRYTIGGIVGDLARTSTGFANQFKRPLETNEPTSPDGRRHCGFITAERYGPRNRHRTQARHITAPTLLLHGTDDVRHAAEHTRRVYDALRGPKRLIRVPGAHTAARSGRHPPSIAPRTPTRA